MKQGQHKLGGVRVRANQQKGRHLPANKVRIARVFERREAVPGALVGALIIELEVGGNDHSYSVEVSIDQVELVARLPAIVLKDWQLTRHQETWGEESNNGEELDDVA